MPVVGDYFLLAISNGMCDMSHPTNCDARCTWADVEESFAMLPSFHM